MDNCGRTLTLGVPGEALNSVLFRLQIINTRYLEASLPVWETEVKETGETDQHEVVLRSDFPKLGEWVLLGQHQGGQAFIPVPGSTLEQLPFPREIVCSVCNTRRARFHLVFRNAEGRLAFVGRSCLTRFIENAGIEVPENFGQTEKMLLDNPVSHIQDTVASVTAAAHFDTNLVVATALWLTEEHGYVNRSRSNQLGLRSTYDEMCSVLSADCDTPAQVSSRVLPAAVIRQWALDEMPSDSDFSTKLKSALARPTLTRHSFALVAALPAAYRRASRVETAIAEGDPIPGADYAEGYIGVPGERQDFGDVIIESVRLLSTGSHLIVMRSSTGHRLTWFTYSKPAGLPDEGEHASLKATVKAHREFRGITETVLTRCSF